MTERMKEFDPSTERHYPLLIVKAVEPGCTTELQVEGGISGRVIRVTTTEDEAEDERAMVAAVTKLFLEEFYVYGKVLRELGTTATQHLDEVKNEPVGAVLINVGSQPGQPVYVVRKSDE